MLGFSRRKLLFSLKKLVQISSDSGKSELNRLDYLDGWRGLAIAFVLISHFSSIQGIDFGRMGVDVFFVLSGMLMANILFVRRVALKTFYKRRISRVIPVFVVFISIVYFFSFLLDLSE